jgi:hypothetical protein
VAASLAQSIVESTNALLERLEAEGFGRADPAIMIDLERSGVPPSCLHDFDKCCRARFAAYTDALAVSSSLQPLGAAVWTRISGSREPSERMTMLLAVRASAELARLRGLASSYRIVAALPVPPAAPEADP